MAREIRRRRGTAAQNDAFTGGEGEIVVDLTNKDLRVHDGLTQGGHLVGKRAAELAIEEALEDLDITIDVSDLDPEALGPEALPGVSEEISRADHVHPLPTAEDVGAETPAGASAKADAVPRIIVSETPPENTNNFWADEGELPPSVVADDDARLLPDPTEVADGLIPLVQSGVLGYGSQVEGDRIEALHGNRTLYHAWESFRRDTDVALPFESTPLQSGQDWTLVPPDGGEIQVAEYHPDGYGFFRGNPQSNNVLTFMLVPRPSAWAAVTGVRGNYRINLAWQAEATSNWGRYVILAYLDRDNWMGVEVGGYVADLRLMKDGVLTNLGTIWGRGTASNGGSAGNRGLVITETGVHMTHSTHGGKGVVFSIDGEQIQNPVAIPEDAAFLFDENNPGMIGFGTPRGAYLHGFAARGALL